MKAWRRFVFYYLKMSRGHFCEPQLKPRITASVARVEKVRQFFGRLSESSDFQAFERGWVQLDAPFRQHPQRRVNWSVFVITADVRRENGRLKWSRFCLYEAALLSVAEILTLFVVFCLLPLGSPFTLKIAGVPDPSKVRVSGPGILDGYLHNYQSQFYVDTHGAGGGELTVKIRGPKGAIARRSYSVLRNKKKKRISLIF